MKVGAGSDDSCGKYKRVRESFTTRIESFWISSGSELRDGG